MSGIIKGILTKTYRGIRVVVSCLGIGSSLGIAGYGAYFVVGGTTGGIAFIVLGVLCLIPSICMLRDVTSILEKIKDEGDRLEKENDLLKKNNVVYQGENEKLKTTTEELTKIKNDYADRNAEYLKLLKEHQIKLGHLDKLKDEIETENQKLKGKVEDLGEQTGIFVTENKELKGNVERINILREQFKREVSQLEISLNVTQEKLDSMELIKEKYSMENDRLHELITENTKQVQNLASENNTLHNTADQLKEQVLKLKELHRESIKLLANLHQAGDIFTEFGKTIDTNVIDLNEATSELRGEIGDQIEKLKHLNEGLTQKMVEELKDRLDTNKDGIVDEKEFEAWKINL